MLTLIVDHKCFGRGRCVIAFYREDNNYFYYQRFDDDHWFTIPFSDVIEIVVTRKENLKFEIIYDYKPQD